MSRKLYVLIACEESQVECAAWRELGCTAFSCDIQPCRRGGRQAWHIWGDVRPLLRGRTQFQTMDGVFHKVHRWDLIIAHPPCTYLCKASAVHMYHDVSQCVIIDGVGVMVNGARYFKLAEGRDLFYECLNAMAPYIAVENPVPLRVAQLPAPSTYVEPWWFGDTVSKKTCYWLRNLPPPIATCINPVHRSLVAHTRGKYRSRTSVLMARAIAKQWYDVIVGDALYSGEV